MRMTTWGNNEKGQLGHGYRAGKDEPVADAVLFPDDIVWAGQDYHFAAALTATGDVLTLGGGVNGEIGNGNRGGAGPNAMAWTPYHALSGVKQLDVGAAHPICLMGDGTVQTWGGNLYGQLGQGPGTGGEGLESTGAGRPTPTVIPGLVDAIQVCAFAGMAAVLHSDGTVSTFGGNTKGQLGLGYRSLEVPTPTLIPGLEGVKAIAGGGYQAGGSMLALMDDGTVMAWGLAFIGAPQGWSNTYSPLPLPGITNAIAVAAGPGHGLVLLDGGELKGWGRNAHGELGLGHEELVPVPVSVATEAVAMSCGVGFLLVMHRDGRVTGSGHNGEDDQLTLTTEQNVLDPLRLPVPSAAFINAGEYGGTVLSEEAGAPPPVTFTPGQGEVLVEWDLTPEVWPPTGRMEPWEVAWREPVEGGTVAQESFTKAASVGADAKAATVGGLKSGVEVEVQLHQRHGHPRFARVTPH